MKVMTARANPIPGWALVVAALVTVVAGRFAVEAVFSQSTITIPHRRPVTSPRVADDYGKPRVVGRVQVDELIELSGLAASQRNPGLFWAHNDSGAGPHIYCLHLSGSSCGVYEVAGARSVDWEDIAAAPGVAGQPSLYIADIGDNNRSRSAITIYRVEEPSVSGATPPASPASPTATLRSDAFTLTYPDRAHDAEGIVVHRETGDLYVITKEYSGRAEVFVARAPLTDGTELESVASMKVSGLLAGRTGAGLSPANDRIIFSTYDSGYELRLPEGAPFDTIWDQRPIPVDLGPHDQGEAVSYTASGDGIVSASEGTRSPIYAVERRD